MCARRITVESSKSKVFRSKRSLPT